MRNIVDKIIPQVPRLMRSGAQGDVSAIALLTLAGIAALSVTIQSSLNNE